MRFLKSIIIFEKKSMHYSVEVQIDYSVKKHRNGKFG